MSPSFNITIFLRCAVFKTQENGGDNYFSFNENFDIIM